MRGHREDASLPEQSLTFWIRDCHAPELAPVKVRNPIVPSEPLVHEGVVGREQIENVPVFADDAFKKQLRLAAERLAKIVVEIGKQIGVRQHVLYVPQAKPLSGEV